MKKNLLFIIGILYFIPVFSVISAYGQGAPEFTNYVNDYAKVLSNDEEGALNSILKDYEDSTSTQLVVLTLESYDDQNGQSLFDFSLKVFKTRGIGQKDKDNGVLLVVVKNLASKNAPGIRIITGYGVEGALPDAICKRIVERMRPDINNGNYYSGITMALADMTERLSGEFETSSNDNNAENIAKSFIIGFILFLVIFIIFLYIISKKDREFYESYSFRMKRRASSSHNNPLGNHDSGSYGGDEASSIHSYGSLSDIGGYSDSGDSGFDGGGGDAGGGGAGD